MFEVRKNESSNKTIRMPNDMIKLLEGIAKNNNISFNKVVVQCCKYALDNMGKEKPIE